MVTLRGMEYVLAFLMIPYLLRTLGPERYGAIAFMQGIIAYLGLFMNYSFGITAPRDIARAEEKEWPRIFSGYFWGIVFLCAAGTAAFFLIYFLLHAVRGVQLDFPLFLALYTGVLGTVFFPIWFFQGIQQMRYITIFNLAGRFTTFGGIFLLVREPSDYVVCAFLMSCTGIMAGVLSLGLLFRSFPGLLRKPDISTIFNLYRDGWKLFISSLAVNLYTTTDIVLLGIFTNHTIVGYYSGADKLILCIRSGVGAINLAIYPYISGLMEKSKEEALAFLKKQYYIYIACGLIGGILLVILAPWGVPWLFGEKYIPSIRLLQIMAFVPLVVAMSNVLGYETMLPLNMEKEYSGVLFLAAVLNLIIIIPLIKLWGAEGAAVSLMITETTITAIMWGILKKRKVF